MGRKFLGWLILVALAIIIILDLNHCIWISRVLFYNNGTFRISLLIRYIVDIVLFTVVVQALTK